MAVNTSLCNVFSHVITAAFDVTCGRNASDVIGELIMNNVCDEITPEEFDTIQTMLVQMDSQVHLQEDVRMVVEHSVMGMTPEKRRVITPTSEAAYNKLVEMKFKSHVESIVYDANRSVPTIITHHVVTVGTVIPGPDSHEC